MTARALFWIGTLIVFSGLLTYYSVEKASITAAANESQRQFEQNQVDVMAKFLENQTDGHKLVKLAKRINPESTVLVKMVILRAYELEPNSRDIAILASTCDSGAKKRIQEIDPLFKNK